MEANFGINSGDRDEVLNNRRKKRKEILPRGNQDVEVFHHNSSHLESRAQNRGPLNKLGFKNLAGPSRLKIMLVGQLLYPFCPGSW